MTTILTKASANTPITQSDIKVVREAKPKKAESTAAPTSALIEDLVRDPVFLNECCVALQSVLPVAVQAGIASSSSLLDQLGPALLLVPLVLELLAKHETQQLATPSRSIATKARTQNDNQWKAAVRELLIYLLTNCEHLSPLQAQQVLEIVQASFDIIWYLIHFAYADTVNIKSHKTTAWNCMSRKNTQTPQSLTPTQLFAQQHLTNLQ